MINSESSMANHADDECACCQVVGDIGGSPGRGGAVHHAKIQAFKTKAAIPRAHHNNPSLLSSHPQILLTNMHIPRTTSVGVRICLHADCAGCCCPPGVRFSAIWSVLHPIHDSDACQLQPALSDTPAPFPTHTSSIVHRLNIRGERTELTRFARLTPCVCVCQYMMGEAMSTILLSPRTGAQAEHFEEIRDLASFWTWIKGPFLEGTFTDPEVTGEHTGGGTDGKALDGCMATIT